MKNNQKGFSVVEILIVIVVVGLLGGAGWYVWQSNTTKENKNTAKSDNNQVTTPKVATKTMTLSEKSVSFKIPETWIKGEGVGCVKGAPIFGNEKILDSVELLASKKQANSKEPYFSVNVCVFDNPDKMTPKEWANSTDGGASIGYPSDNDKTSEKPINGNSAYYLKYTAGEHGGSEEVYYVVASDDKIVYVSSSTQYDYTGSQYDGKEYEPYGGKVYDFRNHESAIQELANSIVIK